MPPIDTRAWNLFGAMALTVTACGGRQVGLASESGGPTTTDDDTGSAEATDLTDDDDDDDDDDGYDHYCGGLSDPEEDRCDSGGYYGDDDCAEHDECEHGELCIFGECSSAATPVAECAQAPTWGAIPLPAETDGVLNLAALDVDGDAQTDLVARRGMDGFVYRAADQSVTPFDLAPGAGHSLLVPGRFDSMLDDGVVAIDTITGEATLFPNDGLGGLSDGIDLGVMPVSQHAAAADLNGDDVVDLVTGGFVAYGDGLGAFAPPMPIPSVLASGPLALAQADGDDSFEVLAVHDEDLGPAIWNPEVGTSSVNFPATQVGEIHEVLAADLGNTGELAFALNAITASYGLLSPFGPIDAPEALDRLALPSPHPRLTIADLGGDDTPELVGYGDEGVVVYRSLLDPAAMCWVRLPDADNDALAIGDTDGDGLEEIIVRIDDVLVRHTLE